MFKQTSLRLQIARLLGLARKLRDDRGIQLIEVSIAAGLMGVAVIGLSTTMLFGVTSVGGSRQRSAATALASERIEQLRNLGYEQVALEAQPAHSSDPGDPDYKLSADGTTYDGGFGPEPIVVDVVSGAIRHFDDPVERTPSELSTYQYVTWVDDPDVVGTQDYKRFTVVVRWKRNLQRAAVSQVSMSSFVGAGNVTVGGATPAPSASPGASPAPTATPLATPVPTPAAACADDVTPPSATTTLLSGAGSEAGYTNSTSVQARLLATDACSPLTAELSNDGASFSSAANLESGISTTVSWTVAPGNGSRTIHSRYRDGVGNVSAVQTATIVLDTISPTMSTNLRTSNCYMSGSNRNATMTWDASTDQNLSGYRVYRSINNGPFILAGPTSSTSMTDTTRKSDQSVRYIVRAYDKAGNEGADSNVLAYAKNAC